MQKCNHRFQKTAVTAMLGHYDAGFTLRTHTHATRQMQEEAAEKMGEFMSKVV